jgi:hypothetical protein
MSMTILVPDWDSGQVFEHREDVMPTGIYVDRDDSVLECDLVDDRRHGCKVVMFKGRLDELPPGFDAVPLEYIRIALNNSPYRGLPEGRAFVDVPTDGPEEGPRCVAHTETYVNSGVIMQSLRTSVSGPYLMLANNWFDEVLRGEHNHLFPAQPALPEQPLSLQVLEVLNSARHVVQAALSADESVQTRENLMADMDQLRKLLRIQPESRDSVVLERVRELALRLKSVDGMESSRTVRQLWGELGIN